MYNTLSSAYWLSFPWKSPPSTIIVQAFNKRTSSGREGMQKNLKADLNKFQMELHLKKCSQKSYKREGSQFYRSMVPGIWLIASWLIPQQLMERSITNHRWGHWSSERSQSQQVIAPKSEAQVSWLENFTFPHFSKGLSHSFFKLLW